MIFVPRKYKWYLRLCAEITRSCNSSIAVAFGHNELWWTPAVNSIFVVSQMLWPQGTMNSGVLWPQIPFLWPLKCCGLYPQWTIVAYCRKSRFCQDKHSLIWASNFANIVNFNSLGKSRSVITYNSLMIPDIRS